MTMTSPAAATPPPPPPPPPSGRRFGGPNGYGHVGNLADQRSLADRGVTCVSVLIAKILAKTGVDHHAKAATSTSWSLRAKGCPILDQGNTGSCTGHGYAGAIYTTLAQDPATCLAGPPSPKECYTGGRELDDINAGAPGATLSDNGANPDSVARFAFEYGVTAMVGPTSDGRRSDCETATINDHNDLTTLEAASTFKLEGIYGLDPNAPNFVQLARAALVAGYALNFACFVDSAFEALGPGAGPVGAPNTKDPNGGGHDLYCDGFHEEQDANGNTVTVFDCVNSWGEEWADGGYWQAGPAQYTPSAADPNLGWASVTVLKVSKTPGSAAQPTPLAA